MASTMDKIKNKVEQVTHTGPYSNKSHDHHHGTTTGTAHTTGTGVSTGAGSTNAGPHSTNVGNKMDPRVDSDLDGSRNAGMSTHHNARHTGLTGSSNTAGPHSTDMANKLDPRVDSDLDGSRNLGAASTGTAGTTGYGSTGLTGTQHYNNPQSTNAGPHSTNLVNTMDPRVDSDRDGSRNMGATGYGTGTAHTGTTGTVGHGNTGLTGTQHYNNPQSTNAGPHSSNLANSMDPRVDSDRDGSRNMGATGYGTTGSANTGLTGTTGHTGTTGAGLTGTGAAPNTAGPHKSDMLNRLDPRVDSDLDGSRTAGGNTTY
jgi:hypothetical protein